MSLASIHTPAMVAEYFHAQLGLHPSDNFRGVCHLVGHPGELVTMDDVAIAVGYDNFIGRTCCMHTVIKRPDLVSRAIVREAFEYPFNVCECAVVLALVESTNEAALSLDKRLGFTELVTLPNAGLEGDLVILQLHRKDCRWLRPH